MAISWRRRKTRQAGIGAVSPVPANPGATLHRASGLYLATTPAGRKLERIAIAPLGFRAEATLTVTDRGVVVVLSGSDPFFIPQGQIRGVRRASWTIDRGVEEDGLNLIDWSLNEHELESYFRMRDPREFDAALERFAPLLHSPPPPAQPGGNPA